MRTELKKHLDEMFEEQELYEAYLLIKKNKYIALILGLIFSPFAYIYIKRWDFFALSLLIFNYLLLGFIIGPIHIYWLYSKAEEKLGL
jgi:hypothetical protein